MPALPAAGGLLNVRSAFVPRIHSLAAENVRGVSHRNIRHSYTTVTENVEKKRIINNNNNNNNNKVNLYTSPKNKTTLDANDTRFRPQCMLRATIQVIRRS